MTTIRKTLTVPMCALIGFISAVPNSGSATELPETNGDPSAITSQLTTAQAVSLSRRGAAREVRQLLDDYLQHAGLAVGPQVLGDSRINVMLEVARASKRPGEYGFHTARSTAYQKAYLTALGKFISQREQEIGNQIGNVFVDNSDNLELLRRMCAPTRDRVIEAKLVQLAEAVVDKALQQLDAAPSGAAPAPDFGCVAAANIFRSRTTRRAQESLSGLRVVFSSEVDGQVGIVLVHSSKFQSSARLLLNGQGANRPAGDPLAELRTQLNSTLDDETLRGTFGTRIVTASNGEPVIVAFGQAGPDIKPSDLDQVLDRKFDTARRIAYNQAAAELARFARVMAAFSSESEQIDETGRNVDIATGAYEEPELVAQTLIEKVDTSSKLKVQGVAEVHAWEIEEDANGQAIVGVVLAWSPSLQSTFGRDAVDPAAREVRTTRSSPKPAQHRAQGAEMKEDW
jgi:hypothetical protein